MIRHSPPWMESAACLNVMAEWVPERRSRESDYLALRFCQDCPVRTTCHAWAVEHRLTGIWGGCYFPKSGRVIDLLREDDVA